MRPFGRRRQPAVAAGAIEDREIELLVGRVERGEEVEYLVDDFGRPRVRAIDFVDGNNRLQPDLQRLANDELGLRHRSFGGIDQQHRTVDHVEDAFHLAAEIGVTGRIDDIDARVPPDDRSCLGEDGNAAFLFQFVGIECALGHALIFAHRAGLAQQLVDQCRLAMIDMGDDRHIAQLHRGHRKNEAAAGSDRPPVQLAKLI